MSKITAMRVLAALRDSLDRDGLTCDVPTPMEGWLPPNYYNGNGFCLRPAMKGEGLDWFVVVSGEKHLNFREYYDCDPSSGETTQLHEPTNPEILLERIRKAFARIGVDAQKVEKFGHQGMWDHTVSYKVHTSTPSWLEAHNDKNSPRYPVKPTLVCVKPPHSADFPAKPIPAYMVDGEVCLTRESVVACVEVYTTHKQDREKIGLKNSTADAIKSISEDGTATIEREPKRDFRMSYYSSDRPSTIEVKPRKVTNAWGDDIEVWPAPHGWFKVEPVFKPGTPFLLDGEMRTKAAFAQIDSQYAGDAPWAEPAPSGPSLR